MIYSYLDVLDCYIMVDGKGYNGVSLEEIEVVGGCFRGSIYVLRDGIVICGILFDVILLPGKVIVDGWFEPGIVIRKADLEVLEEIQGVYVESGDVILFYIGWWKRWVFLGLWDLSEGVAGYHVDVVYFLKE